MRVWVMTVIITCLLGTAILIGLASCGTEGESEELKQLKNVQIREYQGQDLSSISAFRENSIKGPQHIDIEILAAILAHRLIQDS